MDKRFLTASDVADYMSISTSKAYQVIRKLNKELKSAAGKSIHHACIGGLLEHSYNVALEAAKYCDLHPELDRELLVSGAALHDIGKIRTLRTFNNGLVEDTLEGKMIGHSAMGILLIEECISTLLKFYDCDRVTKLEHMVASHHGKRNNGALTDAILPETIVLGSLDAMDAKIDSADNNRFNKRLNSSIGKVA